MRRRRDEAGTVAVIVALGSVALFGFAALAVDLGNALARKGDSQAQADLSALAGGAHLPATKSATDPAVLAVRDYLNRNQPQDDSGRSCLASSTCVSAGDLVDGVRSNGEVYLTRQGERLEVVTPDARVNFGLAASLGFTSTAVSGSATVELGSPGAPLPFFLPRGCLNGSLYLKANTPGGPNPSLSYDPAAGNGQVPRVDAVDPNIFPGGVSSTIRVTGTSRAHNFETIMAADFFFEASGDRVPTSTSASLPVTVVSHSSLQDGEVTLTLPPRVYNTPGRWQVRLRNSAGWSRTYQTILVGDPAPPPTGCGVSSTGDFGFIASPRRGVPQASVANRRNIAEGLDHDLRVFPAPLPPVRRDSCNGNGGVPPPGAVLDTDPFRDDATCVNIQTGMQTDVMTDGLIRGGSGYQGLLEGDTLEGCDRHGGSDEKVRLGRTTNDDVLSCFLPPGLSVGDVTAQSLSDTARHSLDPRIFDSPRFAVVPVIDYDFNPPNGFYPIVGFRPVFITDEPVTSRRGSSYATSTNGIELDTSGNTVRAIKVIPLNPEALPQEATSYGGLMFSWRGSGPRLVRLVR